MARKPMITRTIKATQATLMCVDTEAESIVTEVVTVARTYKDNKALTKAIEKADLLAENLRLVAIKSTEVITQKYGMTEDEFMVVAKKID